MNNIKGIIGSLLFVAGILVVSGSANDCDGRCMEQANDLGTMLLVAAVGIGLMIAGFALLVNKLIDNDFNV